MGELALQIPHLLVRSLQTRIPIDAQGRMINFCKPILFC